MTLPPLPPDGRILFFSRDRAAFGFLSHFHPAPIVLDGEQWPTVEHYYQAQKSLNPAYRAAIRRCVTPAEAKRRAAWSQPPRQRDRDSWFLAKRQLPRPDWDVVKLSVMRRADVAKYQQHPELAGLLLHSGDAEIVEDTARDAFWGIGRDGMGQNWAGRILMEVRTLLRGEPGGGEPGGGETGGGETGGGETGGGETGGGEPGESATAVDDPAP